MQDPGKNDWQATQNNDYLRLSQRRLSEPTLIWVEQFWKIIEDFISNHSKLKKITKKTLTINDFGCNVGHFCRGRKPSDTYFEYNGYDISETYLKIAKEHFSKENYRFYLLDFSLRESHSMIEASDVSVVSATLEHIENYKQALQNIFINTRSIVIIRTFTGNTSLKEFCLTNGSSREYLIRQFTFEQLVGIPQSMGWKYKVSKDLATNGLEKLVCNGKTIARKQRVFVFERQP